uniref:NADH dehydrogenase subunit 6 n=1 Tax=Xiphinema pachtaicum TaxID=260251 RepID=A0A1P8C7A0_9BILA|nr:NADH dehydrogenase subunit 6 [Xiphinema pachtaicum]AOT84273.1 NADH dehydrogenase subunit 6 [Xiphinema pachtaicum]
MMKELIFFMVLSFIVIQSSSLWMSLAIIPFSMCCILNTTHPMDCSGLFFLLYMMVFVGGLLVLLVGVSSVSLQEETFIPGYILVIVSFFFCLSKSSWSLGEIFGWFSWFSMEPMFIWFPLVMLILLLTMVSVMFFSLKSFVRTT